MIAGHVRVLVVCSAFAVASSAAAQDTPIEPDRPDVTNGTHIVDIGLLQIEFGGLYTHEGPRQHAFGSPFTARVGVLEWLELRVGNDGVLTETDGFAQSTSVGNTQLGAKLRLWASPGGVPVLSVLPTVNLPTADSEKGFGSGSTDFTIAFLTGTDIGRHLHADVNYGIGAIGAPGDRRRVAQHLVSVSVSDAISDNWNPYVEAFWFSRQDADTGGVAAIDTGAIYELGARFALDGGLQVGIGPNAPDLAVFAGVTMIVGDILGGHGVHARQRKAQERARKARSSTSR